MTTRIRLGDLLLSMGMITQEQLDHALEIQRETKGRLGEILIQEGYLSEEQFIEVLEFQLGVPHVNLFRFQIDPTIVALIPESVARRYQVLALKKERNKLTVAMVDPLDYYAIDDIRMSTGFNVEPVIASKHEMQVYIERYYGLPGSLEELSTLVPKEEALGEHVTDEDSPVVRLVNQIVHQGLQQRASDIHIDPGLEEVIVRYRVDGLLRTELTLPKSMQNIVITRIKIMANLNIAERRLPQDGRMQVEVDFRQVDIRVSTIPTVHGEKCVMRLLDAKNAVLELDKLGMSPENLRVFQSMIRSAHGMVLITGPTGSGKTTTLYAALGHLSSVERNIITIEDPVEYQLPGINQVQVNPVIGLTFARGLRSILRQDPDIVMVGEIRDSETAEIAVRGSLTGHLVLSTLHTNDAVSSLTRLIDMGIEPFLVASAVTGIVAQRLVRRVCDQCRAVYTPTPSEAAWLEAHGVPMTQMVKGSGCGHCNNTGYRGRLAIHEVVKLDDELRGMVVEKRTDAEYRSYVQSQGMTSLLEDGMAKIAAGLTTLSEVLRVSGWD
ncbi:type II secretion system protein E [Alicyclobacillus contaminans]|uniref:GspE/PulE family protein n=1 Tax=Alicyclobacillus contaminans TaxID=392016 RepID=UPI000414FE2A|nr:GspE/PulE family protein [Alicyclobacillus contaminans]GMA51863.1 type II secretion system protein E [Alicyclobacillus contaminans]